MFLHGTKGGGTVDVLDLDKEGEATTLLLELDDRIGVATGQDDCRRPHLPPHGPGARRASPCLTSWHELCFPVLNKLTRTVETLA